MMEEMAMTDVLIIGGNRFLGKTIAEAFLRSGAYRVYELNRGTRPPNEGIAGQFRCDKSDREAFGKILSSRSWDVIVDTILKDDDLEFVIDALKGRVGHFIHTGSIGVYGDARRIPAPEWLPMAKGDLSEEIVFNDKIAQDQVLMRAFQEKGFPATILRMSNVYGPGDVPLDGWGGRNPLFFQMILEGRTLPIPENGRALLQPGHVQDLGRAFLHAAKRPASIGQIYNICGSWSLMLKDYVRLQAKILGREVRMEYVSQEELLKRFPKISVYGLRFVCQHMCAEISKAERELDWRPEIPLESGLRDNFRWMFEKGLLRESAAPQAD